ncbi:MAG TPA: alpha-galactosidase [Puia sp.]
MAQHKDGIPGDPFATVHIKNDSLILFYQDQAVLKAAIRNKANAYHIGEKKEYLNGKMYQTIVITSLNQEAIQLSAEITASEESFPCEADQPDGLKIVRQVVGLSRSLLNHAVYDRRRDWLLSVDKQTARVTVLPGDSGNPGNAERAHHFLISVSGTEITLRFLPFYYQQHRGLHYFQPWNYTVWQKPVVGWSSWYAYLDNIDETKIRHTADVVAEKLRDFGLEYIQIDDGYQQTPIGMPDTWLQPNHKFPGGLIGLAEYIRSKGLRPAIWTNVSFADSAAAAHHKNLFVRDKGGYPAQGRWVGYSMDGYNPATLEELVAPVYTGLEKMGWQYFKLDALRHLRYEGYNSNDWYFNQQKTDKAKAFRNLVGTVRKSIGPQNFLLACWGIRPELVGLVDGCRIGNDGYSYAGLAQYNSYNNVIWRNDPDHIELTDREAYRSCTATSLTGSLFMLTDKPEKYKDSSLLEAARRSIPVLQTVPGQVYDVDPSRSSRIEEAAVEMSGSGPRSFDASTTTTTGLFLQEISRPYENWIVLGRLDERDESLTMKDLGLDEKEPWLVFEFWTKSFRGVFTGSFIPGKIDPHYHCQVFCLRKKLSHPQVLATSRHISCGGLEIKDIRWDPDGLSGQSELVGRDPYTIYLYEPAQYSYKKFICEGASLTDTKKEGDIRTITLLTDSKRVVSWKAIY